MVNTKRKTDRKTTTKIDSLTREAKHELWRASLASNQLEEILHREKANEFIRKAREECLKKGIVPLFLTDFEVKE